MAFSNSECHLSGPKLSTHSFFSSTGDSTGGSTGGTRGYTDLGVLTGVTVDNQDMGSIATTASSGLGYNDEAYGY
jgi:hypothetical protein